MDISTGNIKRAKFAEALSRNGNYPLKEAFIALEENGDNLIEAAKALVRKFGAPSTPVQPKSPRDQCKPSFIGNPKLVLRRLRLTQTLYSSNLCSQTPWFD